ncbi:MAG: hypothetical protein ACRES4_06175 [Nevskiales bacterium]
MTERKDPFIPLNLLVLDAAGAVLLGLGLAKQFGGVDPLPEQLRVEGYGLGFIIGGIILMLPAFIHIIGKVKRQLESGRGRG